MGHCLALGVTLTVALSAVAAGWIATSNIQLGLVLASVAAAFGLARITRAPAPALLLLWAGLGIAVTWWLVAPAIWAEHPRDPRTFRLLAVWAGRLRSGEAGLDPGLFRFNYLLSLWLGAGWLTWCLERWRSPLLGLLPAVIGLSVTVLNLPAGQEPYVFSFIVLFCALLLWTHSGSLAASWRPPFAAAGAAIALLAVAVGAVLPPLTTTDTSGRVQNGAFTSWAQLMARIGAGSQLAPGATRSVGFSTSVSLSGALQSGGGTVFTYTVPSGTPPDAPLYFRGVNLSRAFGGEWRYLPAAQKLTVDRETKPPYAETYGNVTLYSIQVDMLHPAAADPALLFYPGQLDSVDRPTLVAAESARFGGLGPLTSVAAVTAAAGTSAGRYTVRVEIPDATEQDLATAGTDYPNWLRPYRGLFGGNQAPSTAARISALARQVTAGAANPYEQAKAIELYLRGDYRYTLSPPSPAPGQDPILAFLFDSKAGYCQYFATAMADLLRSLGIPTRLVNGYGSGSFDPKLNAWVVKETDAHTWVESYFPGSGWIPFEPTPDGRYFSIPRALPPVLAGEAGAPASAPTPADPAIAAPDPSSASAQAAAASASRSRSRTISILFVEALAMIALVGLLVLAFLRPRSPAQIWRRSLRLSGWVGVRKRLAETPLEFGQRAALEWAEGGPAMLRLAEAVTTISYSPPGRQGRAREQAEASWVEVRRHALGELRVRLRALGRRR